MLDRRAIALIGASLTCSASACALEAASASARHTLALPEAPTLTLLAIALAGLAALGRKRRR